MKSWWWGWSAGARPIFFRSDTASTNRSTQPPKPAGEDQCVRTETRSAWVGQRTEKTSQNTFSPQGHDPHSEQSNQRREHCCSPHSLIYQTADATLAQHCGFWEDQTGFISSESMCVWLRVGKLLQKPRGAKILQQSTHCDEFQIFGLLLSAD